MLPQTQPGEPRNSSKVNWLISLAFHSMLILALVFFAAREGLLGHQLRKISIQMVKEKPPEKPKEPDKPKQEAPKPETPKEEPKLAAAPKIEPPKTVEAAPPPPVVAAPPAVAPPPAELPSLDFDGGKTVQFSADPVQLYKSALEYELRSKWNRPQDTADDNFVDEVEISINSDGDISHPTWKKNSGDKQWDASVLAAVASVKNIGRRPPPGFPDQVMVRFDVVDTEPITQ